MKSASRCRVKTSRIEEGTESTVSVRITVVPDSYLESAALICDTIQTGEHRRIRHPFARLRVRCSETPEWRRRAS